MSTPQSREPVGVIGNDDYGPVIARRLAVSGFRALYAPLAGAPAVVPGQGLELSPTPTDIASECSVVLAALWDTEILRPLLLGTSDRMGLGQEMMPGSVFVDLGARTPRELLALLGLLGTRGVAVLDAALIGGPEAVAEGRAKVLLGGHPDAVEVALPALAHLGNVERTGPLGSAHAAAALMGYVETAHAVAREEALALGRACGLTPETLTRVLADSPRPYGLNVVELTRRAELAHRIASDHGGSADIIDLEAEKRARQARENR
jgi:3-hydroxyisobutyrate dehydrogenase